VTHITTPAALPAFPPETTLTHGGTAWGVYLAVVSTDDPVNDPVLTEAGRVAGEAGYGPTRASDLGCDQGAPEALGAEPHAMAVAVYVDTQGRAEQARAAFEARGDNVRGVAHVTTYCMD
jgi:hypothetical protein